MSNNFVITSPSRRHEPRVLHRVGCRELHGRAKRFSLGSTSRAYPAITALRCTRCIGDHDFAEARAEAWLAYWSAELDEREARRRSNAEYLKREAAKQAWRAQFEPLRAAAEIAWGRRVEIVDAHGIGVNIGLRLGHQDWYDVGTIYLRVENGAAGVTVGGMNFSTAIVGSAQEAHALSAMFHLIEGWRPAQPLDVPAEAPHFWRAA